jgi:hypothetical protein
MQNFITDEVVGRNDEATKIELTRPEEEALTSMRNGMYLIENSAGQEGVTWNATRSNSIIQTPVKKGTIQRLLEGEYIQESIAMKNKYLLTDKGRNYFNRLG